MKGNREKILQWLSDKDGLFEIKEIKQKRSLSQNAFYWSLVNDLGNKLNLDKQEVHIHLLSHYGQFQLVKVMNNVNVKPYFKYYEELASDNEYTTYKVFKPTSEFNSYEMQVLLSGTINECESVGIHTLKIDEVIKWNLN